MAHFVYSLEYMKWALLILLCFFAACGGQQQPSDDSEDTQADQFDPSLYPPTTPELPSTPVTCTDDGSKNQSVEITGGFLANNQIPSDLTITVNLVRNSNISAGTSSQIVAHANVATDNIFFIPSLHKITYSFSAFGVSSYTVSVAATGIQALSTPSIVVSSADGCHASAHLSQFNY
jgi:hypothetical protein